MISPPNVPLQTIAVGRLGFRLERLLVTRCHKQRRNGHRSRVKHGAFVAAPVGRPSKQNTIWKGYITNQNRGMVLPLHSQLQLKAAFGSAAVATKTPTFAAQSAERVPVKRAKNKKKHKHRNEFSTGALNIAAKSNEHSRRAEALVALEAKRCTTSSHGSRTGQIVQRSRNCAMHLRIE